MENQIKNAITQKTAELIKAKKTEGVNSNLCNVGEIKDNIYSSIAAGIDDPIDAGIHSMRCDEALRARMRLSKLSLEQALENAISQYKEIYLPAAQLAGHTPVDFETFLIKGIV